MGRWYDFVYKNQRTADYWNPIFDEQRQIFCQPKTHKSVAKLRLIDFDRIFREDPNAQVVPCGCDETGTINDSSTEMIKKILFQESDNNLNFIASCDCGNIKGNFALGSICPKCKSEVRTAFANEIRYLAWLEIPDFMPPLLHPAAYRILAKWMGCAKRKKKVLDLLLDVDSELPAPYAGVLGQGPDYFYKNFDDIIRFCLSLNRGAKAKKNEFIEEFVEKYRHCMFIRHIPILNQSLHILTKSGTMTYNDDASTHILKTCIELGNAIYNYRHNPTSNKNYLEQHVWMTYQSYLTYIDAVTKGKLIGKTRFIRKCILASRMHFSARAVIVPIVEDHMADEVHLPWRMVVANHKLELINIMKKHFKMSEDETQYLYNKALVSYDETIHECIKILMAESPWKGIPLLLGRNPTLRHGAVQLFFCTHVKTDPNDDTIGLTPYSISAEVA